MDQKTLNEILEKHVLWQRGDRLGKRADLSECNLYKAALRGVNLGGANLSGAYFYKADLRWANLYKADLERVCLSEADLHDADLRGANLYEADLHGAILRDADLSGADLRGTDLRWANLSGANLYMADFSGADLSGADLYGTNLYETSLYRANLCEAKRIPYIPMACPETGEFIAWKKAYDKDGRTCLVKLTIPEDARRSSATGRKCRADKAVVLSIEPIAVVSVAPKVAYSMYNRSVAYEVGRTIFAPDFDPDRFNECAPGIHFFINRQEAIDYRFT